MPPIFPSCALFAVHLPKAASFDTLSVIALFFVIGKLIEQAAWKFGALSAMFMLSSLTT